MVERVCQACLLLDPAQGQHPDAVVPHVTVALIVINVIGFVFFEHNSPSLGAPSDSKVVKYGLIPYELTHPGKECDLVDDVTLKPATGTPQAAPEQRGRPVKARSTRAMTAG